MPLDIVIFGVIAVILIFRFLGVLGQNDKSDGRPRRDAFGKHKKYLDEKQARREKEHAQREKNREKSRAGGRVESTVKQSVAARPSAQMSNKVYDEVSDKTLETGDAVTLSDKAFLEGAKAAFAMILEAYAAGDQANLKALLDKEMLARMNDEIEKRQKAEERLEISLLEIVEARIAERAQDEHFEQIAVSFTSKQCHLLFDKDNKLIEGDPDEEELLHDLWTFRQNLASQEATWFLCSTRSQDAPKSVSKAKTKTKASSNKARSKSPKAL